MIHHPSPLYVCLLMMSGAPVLVILICMSSINSALESLHREEGIITEAECESIGSTRFYDQCEVVAQIILTKSINEILKILVISEQYQLLDIYCMGRIKGLSVCDSCIIYFKFVQFSMKW